MTRLKTLRQQLRSLRRWRRRARLAAAYSATISTALLAVAAIFAVDVLFELDVLQRLLVMLLGLGAVFWGFRKLTAPLLGQEETELQLALMVEERHRISSDLVAALQFESPEAKSWGSAALEASVIERVATLGRGFDVFEGFSREQMLRRLAILTLLCLGGAAVIGVFPAHARIFLDRLLMASSHYPSRTAIQRVVVNEQLVLVRERNGTQPSTINCPESQSLAVQVQCDGRLPRSGTARLRSESGRKRTLDLRRLTLDERRGRLEWTATALRDSLQDGPVELGDAWATRLAAQVQFDVPHAAELLTATPSDHDALRQSAAAIESVLQNWPGNADRSAVYEGNLRQLVEPVEYQLYLGDAWTDPARVDMIPLPMVDLTLTPIPPEYAKAGQEAVEGDSRQISVLEGSQVDLSIECKNGKQLAEAWVTVLGIDDSERYDLTSSEKAESQWSLPTAASPFSRVLAPLRFEVQVQDTDGMQLETPIRGYIRIKADRPPSCSASVIHRVVLPTARPRIEYHANDDYGIAELTLRIEVERGEDEFGEYGEPDICDISLLNGAAPLLADALPLTETVDGHVRKGRSFPLDLASLQIKADGQSVPAALAKGDRLKITLMATDYRGDEPGESYLSDPISLEIGDRADIDAQQMEQAERAVEMMDTVEEEELKVKQALGIPLVE